MDKEEYDSEKVSAEVVAEEDFYGIQDGYESDLDQLNKEEDSIRYKNLFEKIELEDEKEIRELKNLVGEIGDDGALPGGTEGEIGATNPNPISSPSLNPRPNPNPNSNPNPIR
jgi:hypothetical protein